MAKNNTVATTFNMLGKLKERAQMYVVTQNSISKEKRGTKPKINLGILLNLALQEYLDRVEK